MYPQGVRMFNVAMEEDGWLLYSFPVYYPDFGDLTDISAHVTLGIHSSARITEAPQLVVPAAKLPHPFDSFIL